MIVYTLCYTFSVLCYLLSGFPPSLLATFVSQTKTDNFPLLNTVFILFNLLVVPEIVEWNAFFPWNSSLLWLLWVFFYFSLYFPGLCLPLSFYFPPSILNVGNLKFSFSVIFPLKVWEFLLIHWLTWGSYLPVTWKIDCRWQLCLRHDFNHLCCDVKAAVSE